MLDMNRVKFIEIVYRDHTTKIIKMIDDKLPFTDYVEIFYNLNVKKVKTYKTYEIIERKTKYERKN